MKINYECNNCNYYGAYITHKNKNLHCKECHIFLCKINKDWNFEKCCPFCSNKQFYKRKNFNQILGAIIVLIGGILAISISYYCLIILSMIDYLFYKLISNIGICYKCSAEFHQVKNIDRLSDFEHHKAEIYQ